MTTHRLTNVARRIAIPGHRLPVRAIGVNEDRAGGKIQPIVGAPAFDGSPVAASRPAASMGLEMSRTSAAWRWVIAVDEASSIALDCAAPLLRAATHPGRT
jgi:hypothetical protein